MITRLFMIIVIICIVFGGGYYAYQQLVPPPEDEDEILYATQPVTRGDITVGVTTSGTLSPSRGGGIQVPGGRTPTGGSAFTIEEVFVSEGDAVEQGQLLIQLSASELENQVAELERQIQSQREALAILLGVRPDQVYSVDPNEGIIVRADISGRIVDLRVNEGQELRQGHIVTRIVDDSRFYTIARLTPSELTMVNVGDNIALKFTDYDGWVEASVIDINPEPIPEASNNLHDTIPGSGSGYQFVHWITIEADNPGLVRPGMLARVGILDDGDSSEVYYTRYYAEIEGYVNERTILASANAIASHVHVREMQRVEPGDKLVSLSGEDARALIQEQIDQLRSRESQLNQLKSQFQFLQVKAPMQGVIAHLDATLGQTVHPGYWLGSIYNTSDMQMWVQVDDIDVLFVQPGAEVDISVTALPDETFYGEVIDVSAAGEDVRGISRFQVSIRFEGGPQLRPGMQAQAHIKGGSVSDVLLVPLEAIFEEDGQPMVEVLDDNGNVRLVSVRLGLMDDRYAEVQSGLEDGQEVITGSTADLLPSLRIRSEGTLLPGGAE